MHKISRGHLSNRLAGISFWRGNPLPKTDFKEKSFSRWRGGGSSLLQGLFGQIHWQKFGERQATLSLLVFTRTWTSITIPTKRGLRYIKTIPSNCARHVNIFDSKRISPLSTLPPGAFYIFTSWMHKLTCVKRIFECLCRK